MIRKLKQLLVNQERITKRIIVIFNDGVLIILSFLFSSLIINYKIDFNWEFILFNIFIIILFWKNKIYENVIRHIGHNYTLNLFNSLLIAHFLYFLSAKFLLNDLILSKVIIFCLLTSFSLIVLSRIIARLYLYQNKNVKEKIALYIDKEYGRDIINIANNSEGFELVAIIQSDPKYKGLYIDGIKSFGIEDLEIIIEKDKVEKLFIASRKDDAKLDKEIIEKISHYPLKVFEVPNLSDIVNKKRILNNMKNLSLEDIMDRELSIISINEKENIICNKNILITGAGGSIGSVLSKQILENKPKSLIILDNSEIALFNILSELKKIDTKSKIISKLADITNQKSLKKLFKEHNIDIVYHAAAYKHVNILENEIEAAVNNNIFGTYYLVQECLKNNINNLVMISTDKAVDPSTIMGVTKKFCELIVINCNRTNKNNNYSSVRFGNVFNSSGSVIQIFKKQIKEKNNLTLTDPNVTRFFMSTDEAVSLVLKASTISKGGEIFVLDMGRPIKILDIAKKMIHLSGNSIKSESNPDGDISIDIIGLQKGEKLHEILSEDDVIKTKENKIMQSKDSRKQIDNLDQIIKSLSVALEENNESSIKEILKEISLL